MATRFIDDKAQAPKQAEQKREPEWFEKYLLMLESEFFMEWYHCRDSILAAQEKFDNERVREAEEWRYKVARRFSFWLVNAGFMDELQKKNLTYTDFFKAEFVRYWLGGYMAYKFRFDLRLPEVQCKISRVFEDLSVFGIFAMENYEYEFILKK